MAEADEPEAPMAPASAPVAVPPSNRPRVAGVLLLFLFGIATFQGVFQLAAPPDPEDAGFRVESVRFAIEGAVVSPEGDSVANATVAVGGEPGAEATTGADGRFRIEDVASGYNAVNVTHPEYANVTVRVVLLEDMSIEVRMPAGGDATAIDHESISRQRTIARVLGVFQLAAGALSLAGGITAYQRRRRGLAITGCFAGFFGALPLSVLVAPVAFVLVLRRRRDWRT